MAVNRTRLQALIRGIQTTEPALFQVLNTIIGELTPEERELGTSTLLDGLASTVLPADVVTFEYSLLDRHVELTWLNPDDPTPRNYEIRKGTVWATADIQLVTASTRAVFDPLTEGTHTYLIKAIDSSGNYSTTEKSLTVVIPAISGMTMTITALFNVVLINWTKPTSAFIIDYYKIEKDDVEQAQIRGGTFTILTESFGGTYTYKITPFDIAGNEGGSVSEIVEVSDPNDFSLQTTQEDTNLDGTKVHCFLDAGSNRIVAPVEDSRTWTQHYTDAGETTVQGFIDSGYTYWSQPSYTGTSPKASYVQTFDFGSIQTDVLLTADYDFNPISAAPNTVTFQVDFEVSDDDITYTSKVTGSTYYAVSVRYARVTITFTTPNDRGLTEFFNFRCLMSIREGTDEGAISALAADGTGTVVSFAKSFDTIKSVTATVETTVARYVVVTAVTTSGFKVLVFDDAGVRQDEDVYWKARGKV